MIRFGESGIVLIDKEVDMRNLVTFVVFIAAVLIVSVAQSECRIEVETVKSDDGREVNVCILSQGFGGIAFECEEGFGEYLWKSYGVQCELHVSLDNNVPSETCQVIGAWYNPEKHSCEYVVAPKR